MVKINSNGKIFLNIQQISIKFNLKSHILHIDILIIYKIILYKIDFNFILDKNLL